MVYAIRPESWNGREILKTSEKEVWDNIFRIQSFPRQEHGSPMKHSQANTESRNVNTTKSKVLSANLKRETIEMLKEYTGILKYAEDSTIQHSGRQRKTSCRQAIRENKLTDENLLLNRCIFRDFLLLLGNKN